jgi:hypothetical protein
LRRRQRNKKQGRDVRKKEEERKRRKKNKERHQTLKAKKVKKYVIERKNVYPVVGGNIMEML